jgi:hypothetical protein
MKKKILVGLVGTMMISSVCLAAAPVTELAKGETVVGLSHSDFDVSTDGFYLEHGIADKFIIGLDSNDFDGSTATDFYGKYKLDKNVNLTLGFRDYEGGDSKLTYGIEGSTALAEKTVGYASLKNNSDETEWKFGATYAIAPQINLDLNYTSHNTDYGDLKGVGFGINYKF